MPPNVGVFLRMRQLTVPLSTVFVVYATTPSPSPKQNLENSRQLLNAAFASVTQRYTSYFGLEHLSSAVRLLEYRGVALCIEEMLKIVQANVR